MDTLVIELTNPKALDLVNDLEALQIIRVVSRHTTEPAKLSERFAGKLSAETAKALHKHIDDSRDEWDQRSI